METGRGLPDSSARGCIRLSAIYNGTLLVQDVRVDPKCLEKFLASMVGFFPVVNTHRAFALDKALQHEVVLVGDPLLVLFLSPRVQTRDLSRSYSFKCL